MRINTTVALTFTLLALMIGAGVLSGGWGYSIGREALKGITQPDSRPTSKGTQQNAKGREELVILKEEDVLKTVKEKMNSVGRSASADSSSKSSSSSSTTSP